MKIAIREIVAGVIVGEAVRRVLGLGSRISI